MAAGLAPQFALALPWLSGRRRLAQRLAEIRPPDAAPLAVAGPARDHAGFTRLLDPLLGLDRGSCVDDGIALLPALLMAGAAGVATAALAGPLLALPLPVVLLGALAAAFAAARLWISQRRRAGLLRIEIQFALALGVIIRCVRAGLPVVEAMRAVAAELPAPTGNEFRRCVDQVQLGMDFDEALEALAGRCPLADYRFFAVSVALQRQTGGNLAETLDNLAETVRRRRALRDRAHALTAEAKATVVVLALLPLGVAALLLFVSPDYIITMVTTTAGRNLLGIALVAQGIGLFLVRLIARRAVP